MANAGLSAWEDFISQHPNAHLLQTVPWGGHKLAFGWEVERLITGEVGAQVLFRSLRFGLKVAYIPRGPVFSCKNPNGHEFRSALAALLPELDALCKRRRCVFLKVEPDLWEGEPGSESAPEGFVRSSHSIQPPRTVVVDLSGGEDQILGRMKQKTRYNIRLAEKKGVSVRASEDIGLFYQLMQATAQRDAFAVHSLDYYRQAYDLFHPRGECELLLAEYEGRPLGGLMAFSHGSRAYYLYGASGNEYRELMPTYLLQWEAMRWARRQGCREYDLWGVPDEDEATLEENFTGRSDGLWGVYRFKRGFGGELKRIAGPWDRPYLPFVYALYRRWAGRHGSL